MEKKSLNRITAALTALIITAGMAFPAFAEEQGENVSEAERKRAEFINELSAREQRGDINGDGTVNVFDVMRYKMDIIAGETITASERNDVTADGTVDGKDISVVKNDVLGKSKIWSYKTMPKMDGASLNANLEAGFTANMLGLSFYQSKFIASENDMKEAFNGLVSGKNDIVFTTGVTEEQKKSADEAGVKLFSVPVAKEGLVFIVNKNNPVDSLTADQLRDIYSGKITNWKDVGGNDEVIVTFQRNENSISQKYMTEFMNGRDTEDVRRFYVWDSEYKSNVTADYENLKNAIGFSVYSDEAQVYADSSDIKFIAVDGVSPSKETVSDGTYPLLSTVSALYTEGASQGTKNFIKWAVSDEGQEVVRAGGYIPVNDTETADNITAASAKGTGKERSSDFEQNFKCEKYILSNKEHSPFTWKNGLQESNAVISCLKDKELEAKINDDIISTMFGQSKTLPGEWSRNVTVLNGFINITFIKNNHYNGGYNKKVYICDDCFTFNYDLQSGKKLEKFSDLFYKDEEFASVVSRAAGRNLAAYCPEWLTSDYLGMPGDITDFDFEHIVLKKSGPYSADTIIVAFHDAVDYDVTQNMVISEGSGGRELFDENAVFAGAVTLSEGGSYDWMKNFSYGEDGKMHFDFRTRSRTKSELEEKNKLFDSMFEKSCALYKKEFPECSDKIFSPDHTVRVDDPDTAGEFCSVNAITVSVGEYTDLERRYYYFDLDTKEEVLISDIFGKDYEKYNHKYYISGYDADGDILHLYSSAPDASMVEEKITPDKMVDKYIIKKKYH